MSTPLLIPPGEYARRLRASGHGYRLSGHHRHRVVFPDGPEVDAALGLTA